MILFPLLAAFIIITAVLSNAVAHSTDDPKIIKAWSSARNVLIAAAFILIAIGGITPYLWPGGSDPLRGY